jgi:plasmid stabilization system protein ParE
MTRSEIEWTEQATRQLDQAHDYIALSNSEDVAFRITTLIVTTIQQLTAFPMSGRAGRVPGTPRAGHFQYTLHRSLRR